MKEYYTHNDFEIDIIKAKEIILALENPHIVALYRGALPFAVRLSNELDCSLSIIEYQSYHGEETSMKLAVNKDISSSDHLIIIDDILDSGKTMEKAKAFISELFPLNKITILTIYGKGPEKHLREHLGNWIQFIPWEGV